MNSFQEREIAPLPKPLAAILTYGLVVLLAVEILFRWMPFRFMNAGVYQMGVSLMAVVFFGWLLIRPFQLQLSFVLIPLAAAIAWPLVQLVTHVTVSRWETENAVFLWSCNFLAAFFALQLTQTVMNKERLLRSMAIVAFAVTTISLLQYFSAPDKLFWQISLSKVVFGPFVSRDLFAAFGELVMPLCFWFALKARKNAWLWVAMAATIIAAIIAGASRAGAILIVLEMVLLIAAAWRAKVQNHSGKIILTFVVAVVVLIAVVGIDRLKARLKETDPYSGRREILQSALGMIAAKPVTGFGLGNFINVYPGFAKADLFGSVEHAHNDWAEWAADGGIPFFGFLAALAAWLAPRAYKSIWGIGILVTMIHSLVDFPLQEPAITIWLFTIVGVAGNPSEGKQFLPR